MSVTKVQGFLAHGLAAGIKKNGNKDLALIYSPVKCAAAAVYTTNKVQAAPLKVTQEHLLDGHLQGIVVNSGNANACNGEQGYADAKEMCSLVASELRIAPQLIAVASTGVIGMPMPMGIVREGIPHLVRGLSKDGGFNAAQAIMTTDTFAKEVFLSKKIDGRNISIGGMAKGSGMIHPNMATMLAFLTTDINITPELLKNALRNVVAKTFNMVSVDGDTSTNDMVIVLANGMAGNAIIDKENEEYVLFTELLEETCQRLAKMIAKDGEGASKLIEVQVKNAPSEDDAKKAALAVIKSSLVKAAIFGEDANWGRIICAVGYSGCAFIPEKASLWLESNAGSIQTFKEGAGLAFDEDKARKILQEKEIIIKIDLQSGENCATAWGCDLTYDYVKINASYRS